MAYQIYDSQTDKIIGTCSTIDAAHKLQFEEWEKKMEKYNDINDATFWSFFPITIMEKKTDKFTSVDTEPKLVIPGVEYKYYAFYRYGSRIFNTAHDKSDYDYIVVTEGEPPKQVSVLDIDISYYSRENFQEMINDYRMFTLSCFFLTEENVIMQPNEPFVFTMDRQKFRTKVSNMARHSFHKCKMKMKNEDMDQYNTYYTTKKSLYHAIRIFMFGTQIANKGKITNYYEAKSIYDEIMAEDSKIWETYEEHWGPKFKKHMKIFHNAIPKIQTSNKKVLKR